MMRRSPHAYSLSGALQRARARTFPFMRVAEPLADGAAQLFRLVRAHPHDRVLALDVRKLELVDALSRARCRFARGRVVERHHVRRAAAQIRRRELLGSRASLQALGSRERVVRGLGVALPNVFGTSEDGAHGAHLRVASRPSGMLHVGEQRWVAFGERAAVELDVRRRGGGWCGVARRVRIRCGRVDSVRSHFRHRARCEAAAPPAGARRLETDAGALGRVRSLTPHPRREGDGPPDHDTEHERGAERSPAIRCADCRPLVGGASLAPARLRRRYFCGSASSGPFASGPALRVVGCPFPRAGATRSYALRAAMVRLHINIDHVATLRNARGTPYPDPVFAAGLCELAGADGITAHLREDRRHMRDADIAAVARAVAHHRVEPGDGRHRRDARRRRARCGPTSSPSCRSAARSSRPKAGSTSSRRAPP